MFEYLIAMLATLLMIILGILTSQNIFNELVIRLSYCKYMANINYLSICIFQATVTNLVERALPN